MSWIGHLLWKTLFGLQNIIGLSLESKNSSYCQNSHWCGFELCSYGNSCYSRGMKIGPCWNAFLSHVFCNWILSQTPCCRTHMQTQWLFLLHDHQHLDKLIYLAEEMKTKSENEDVFQINPLITFIGPGIDSCAAVSCFYVALWCRMDKHTGSSSDGFPSHAFCSLTCPRTACHIVDMKSPGCLTGLIHARTLQCIIITLLTG